MKFASTRMIALVFIAVFVNCRPPQSSIAPNTIALPSFSTSAETAAIPPPPEPVEPEANVATQPSEKTDANFFNLFPQLSSDGASVAIIREENNAGGGQLFFQIRTVAGDRLVREVAVPEGNAVSIHAEATRFLGGQTWTKLFELNIDTDPTAPERQGGVGAPFRNMQATGHGLRVQYHEPTLIVRNDLTKTKLLTVNKHSWTNRGYRETCEGCHPCPPWLADLGSVWVDADHRVLVLRVVYQGGSDSCREPIDEWHVLPLPRR